MKLLQKTDANARIKKDNEELIDTNIRLRKYANIITKRLNSIKETYEPEKVKLLQDFERFARDLVEKKSVLLQELTAIETLIQQKKEIYYGLIEKQDILDERIYVLKEQEKKLNLRQAFVEELENKQKELSTR